MPDRTVTAAGLDFHVIDAGPSDGATLLLMHGGTETSALWSGCLDALAAECRVIAPDSRGHGATLNPEGTPLDYALMADDMAAVLDALDIAEAVVGGFSDGANIAFEFARRHPSRCQAILLHGLTTAGRTECFVATLSRFFCVEDFDDPADLDAMAIEHESYVSILEGWHAAQGPDGWRDVVRLVQPLFANPPSFTAADYAAIACPALVITGDRDPCFPVAEHIAVVDALADAELAVWPGVGHGLPERPALFTDLVLDFIDRRCRPTEGDR